MKNMRTFRSLAVAATAVAVTATACSSGGDSDSSPSGGHVTSIGTEQYVTGTATGDVEAVTWYGDYRPIYTLDPIKLADYPEETITANICEPMLTVEPDYTIKPDAVSYEQVDDTHLVLTLTDGVTFSDGSAVTAEDVAYSLNRNLDPSQLSNYAYAFSNVKSIDVTGEGEVTITLSRPDSTVVSSLATNAGAIVKKSFAEKAGDAFGSPTTGVMCTGPFQLKSYDGTSKLVMTRNENYWDADRAAKAKTFTFVFPADATALANGLASGDIDGAMNVPSNLVSTLKTATGGKLYVGDEGSTPINVDMLMTSSTGTLADPKVRQALSKALDRSAIAEKIFQGAADPLYRVSGPGLWGYERETFEADYDKLVADPDVDAAKALVDEAGATGKSAVFAYPSGDPQSEQLATILQQTAQSIGIDLQIKALPLQQYGSLFSDPAARSKYDAILTKNYVEQPDPLIMDRLYGQTGGGTNFSDYSNATVDASLKQATEATDDAAKAEAVLAAEHQLDQDLPSIPIVGQRALVFQSDEITGAPLTFSYMTSAWAARIGAK